MSRAQRCQEIAKRFQHHQQAGTLDYISHGYLNNRPAHLHCSEFWLTGTCKDVLITLQTAVFRNPSQRQKIVEHLWLIGT